jgi:hypothetical protein
MKHVLIPIVLFSAALCLAQEAQEAAPVSPEQQIERAIRGYYEAMARRDGPGMQAVVAPQLFAVEAGADEARAKVIDASNPNALLPPPTGFDYDKATISDLTVRVSETHPTVAAASYTLAIPIPDHALEELKAALDRHAAIISPAQKAAIEKMIEKKVLTGAMFALLAHRKGEWRIVSMTFPR